MRGLTPGRLGSLHDSYLPEMPKMLARLTLTRPELKRVLAIQKLRYAIVSAIAGAVRGTAPSFSIAFHAERRAVEREVLVCHRANRGLVGHEPRKVGTDVSGSVLVPIERNHAVLCLAQPQTPYLLSHLLLHLDPWPALSKAATECLGGVGHPTLWCGKTGTWCTLRTSSPRIPCASGCGTACTSTNVSPLKPQNTLRTRPSCRKSHSLPAFLS